MENVKWVRPTELQRFWFFVKKSDTCWLWVGGKDPKGYGTFSVKDRKTVKAHRYAYALLVGKIPPSLFVLHSCHNPSCVNPEHLRVGTHLENMKDSRDAGRNRRLSPEQIQVIRNVPLVKYRASKLAEAFKVSRQLIADIRAGRCYL